MYADYIFINAEVLTVNENNEIAEAVAIRQHRIIAVGASEEIARWKGPETIIIDAQRKTLVPGFIDAHLHFILYGLTKQSIDCKRDVSSIEQIIEALRIRAKSTPKGQWLRVTGFNENAIKERRYPTIDELNYASTDHPIVVIRTCNHIGVVNQVALDRANITPNTPNPQGGIIEKINDRLTGRLIETAYMQFNEVAAYTEEEIINAMKGAQHDFFQYGITSIHDAGAFDANSFRLMQQATQNGTISLRIYAMIASLTDCKTFTEKMIDSGVMTCTGNERFKIGPAKLFTDGGSTGPAIATREGYTSDPNNHGILYHSKEELTSVLGEAHALGYQVTVHAQGDRAIELYLNVIEEAAQREPRVDHRHRIEHAGLSMPDLQKRIKTLEMIPISNPAFPYEFGDIYVEHYGDRINYMFACGDYIKHDILAAIGSDAPVTTVNPMIAIHAAVNRTTADGKPFGQQQKISVMDAIRMYTYNGAYASFDEHQKGSIEVGKLADIVLLDRSIIHTPKEAIHDITVEMTMLDGEIVYDATTKQVNV